MKVLLDTTYLLPLIGIHVQDIPHDLLHKLMVEGHEVFVSDISIFKLAAKGAKFVVRGLLEPVDVIDGLRALVNDVRINRVPLGDVQSLTIALKLRGFLTDFVDCLILASAIASCDVLITEDADILALRDTGSYMNILNAYNPGFRLSSFKEFLAAMRGEDSL